MRKAREATADQSAVQERIGLDGKTRKVPSKEPEPEPPAPTSPCPCPLRDDEPHIRLSKTWLAVAGEPIAADADEQEADIGDKEKPDRIITKAELMPLLKSILKYYKQNDDWCEFPDADIELFDTLVEAEEVLHFLVWEARRNDTLKKAIEQRDKAEEDERKAQRKIDREKAKETREAEARAEERSA